MYSDAFLADTRIDADAVNTVTIKVKVWIDFSQMTLKYQTLPPPWNFSPSNSTNEVNTCTIVYGAAAVYNVRSDVCCRLNTAI